MNKVLQIIRKHPLDMERIETSYTNYTTFVSDELYQLLNEIEGLVYPTREDDYIKIYKYLFCPVKVRDKTKFIPIRIYYFKEYDIYQIDVETKGLFEVKSRQNNFTTHYPANVKEPNEDVKSLIFRIYEFTKMQKERPTYVGLLDIHKGYLAGSIKAKYVKEPKISKEEAKEIVKEYKQNLKNRLPDDNITLRDYLTVAKIVYRGIGFNTDLDLKELYKTYANGKDCGLITLPLDDSDAFKKWMESEAYCGGRPFEIVKKEGLYGISLYPPEDGRFILSPGDLLEEYYRAAKELIREKIPFISYRFFQVLNVLTGEAILRVNDFNDFPRIILSYKDVKRKDKIEWDEINEVDYRRRV